ncbi:M56 family metallopeptidase [Cohnella hashimotonis]|uniref:M56 family metallopeptidase n=1 Tax=Cohnella hashimotonis TaxID=2826895 RepID=A0ABT6TS65_9BACL|nr:M56 family metallopeptidase [Cohnella hashimotonis]MDI4649691.1 M56 family metallopeptidase [Cohnella hashimotonis]
MIVLKTIFLLILSASLGSAVIVLLLLFIRRLLHLRLKPAVIHFLWLLVLIKLLIPVGPSSSISLFNLMPQTVAGKWTVGQSDMAAPLGFVNDREDSEPQPSASAAPASNTDTKVGSQEDSVSLDSSPARLGESISIKATSRWSNLLRAGLFIWLGGIAFLSIYHIIGTLVFRKRVRFSRPIHNEEVLSAVRACSEKLGLKRTIPVYESSCVQSPCIYGTIKPRIFMPEDILVIADSRQLTHILLHELAHDKRKDLWLNSLWTLAVWLHWFNPLVWLARRKMVADRELACDAVVLEALGEKESASYGLTLLMLSRLFSRSSSMRANLSHFFNNTNETKRRIAMITKFKQGSSKLSVMAIVSILFLGAILLTNANAESNASKAEDAKKENTVSSFRIDRLMPSFKWFHNLGRALAFASFDFKVPDYVPEGYRLKYIDMGKNFSKANQADLVEYVSITFVENFGRQDERNIEVYASRGKGTMLEHNLLWGASYSREPGRALSYRQEALTVGDRTGTMYTTSRSRYKQPPETAKSFVWQENEITYAVNYYSKDLDHDELAKIVQSAVWPDQVRHVDYSGAGNSFPLYDEKDLQEAKDILGFPVKFPFDISAYGLKLSDSILLQANDQNTGFPLRPDTDALWHSYRVPYDSSIYELNDYISFYQSKAPVVDVNKLSFLRTLEISGIGISVYTDPDHVYSEPIHSDNNKLKFKSQTYYVWEQNGIHYTAYFVGVDRHQEENLEALVLAPVQ